MVDMVDGRATALLCDFGLSKIQDSQPSGLTTSGFHYHGSTRYWSPELICNSPRRDLRSDVWAWGCVAMEVSALNQLFEHSQVYLLRSLLLYYGQITTNVIPYKGLNGVIVIKAITEGPPALVETLDMNDTIRGIVKTCWSPAETRPHIRQCHEKLVESLGPGQVSLVYTKMHMLRRQPEIGSTSC